MAVNPEQIHGLDLNRVPRWALWARLPLQPLAMLWVWRARDPREPSAGLRQQFFEQIPGGPEEGLDVAEQRVGVVDQFDRLVERDVFDRAPQRAGDEAG